MKRSTRPATSMLSNNPNGGSGHCGATGQAGDANVRLDARAAVVVFAAGSCESYALSRRSGGPRHGYLPLQAEHANCTSEAPAGADLVSAPAGRVRPGSPRHAGEHGR